MASFQSPNASLFENNGFHLDPVALNNLVVELTGLLENATTQDDFCVPYLERILEVTKATGGALWQRHPQGHLDLIHEVHFHSLQLDQTKNGSESHALLLEEALLTQRASWIEPTSAGDTAHRLRANFSPCALLLVPVLVEDKTVGLLELIFPPEQEKPTKRALMRLGTEVAGFVAAFLHKRQWKALRDEQQAWQELEAFAVTVHQSLDPKTVACLVANDGKRLVKCDQLSVARWQGRSCEVLAISGAVMLERNNPLVQAMQTLLACVCRWGEILIFQGTRDESLPPKVLEALDAYLALSNSRLLIALPLKDQDEGNPQKISGILLAESFGGNPQAEQVRQRLDFVARHAGPGLRNALTMDRLPLQWLSGPLASFREGLTGSSRLQAMAFMTLLILCSAFLIFFPLPLKSEAMGELVPSERRIVYSPFHGKIIHLATQHGDRVEKGQELLFIEDLDTQLKVDQLSVRISSLSQKLNLLEDHLNKPLTTKERGDYLNERIHIQYELGKARVERLLLLSDNRSPKKSPILAPLGGQVLTFDAREKLLGKTVKPGDPLLRLGWTRGPWEVELFIPEREAGRVRDALFRQEVDELNVDLLMTSEPTRIYSGKLDRRSLGGETTVHNDKIVLPARVALTDFALLAQLENMPVGVEVRARIHCGKASAGYVWFNEIWNFLYEKFAF